MTDQQRTTEWFAQRLGKVTASKVADVIARTKSGYSASRENYLAQLVVERFTGQPTESYTNAAMQWVQIRSPSPEPHTRTPRVCLSRSVALCFTRR